MSSTSSVITNPPSLAAQHHSTQNQRGLQGTLFRFLTGQLLFRGGKDPAGLVLAGDLTAVRGRVGYQQFRGGRH